MMSSPRLRLRARGNAGVPMRVREGLRGVNLPCARLTVACLINRVSAFGSVAVSPSLTLSRSHRPAGKRTIYSQLFVTHKQVREKNMRRSVSTLVCRRMNDSQNRFKHLSERWTQRKGKERELRATRVWRRERTTCTRTVTFTKQVYTQTLSLDDLHPVYKAHVDLPVKEFFKLNS